ncbi:hypothetical protein INT47_011420 [Mucor saturninus]|uniref:RNI-like protein n=1 Tax=Mucor saturninus TaxID=64648 RepID=A0A8H7QY79_9FUNG|nr:hypothetical protein INT47_011420 [Mucor saturninus]
MNENNRPDPTEHGIQVRHQSRRERRAAEELQAAAGTNGEPEAMEGVETSIASAAAQSESILYRPTQKKKKPDDDDAGDEDENAFAPSSSRKLVPARARILFCVECKGRFVRKLDEEVTQTICPSCLNGTNQKKKTVPRKKKIVAIQKEPISKDVLPSLQDICIAVVASYVDDLESFGIISDESVEKLSKIISKNRKLNDVTSRLFMEPVNVRLRLYDCTNMNEVSLMNISQFCPRLQYLQLVYCGHITDQVLDAYAERLTSLKSLQLSGPFLVTTEAWDNFFKTVSTRLECFEVRHTARFTAENIMTLTDQCPNLRELRLGQLFQMESDWLSSIGKLKKLTVLEITWPSGLNTLQTAHVVELLSKVGPQLTELSLNGGYDLEDNVLTQGVLKYCTNLKKLNLEQCHKLTAKAMIHLMKSWKAKGLTHLNIERCILFDDRVLKAVMKHSGATLKHLNIHSLEKVTAAGLESLQFKELAYLNCGFIRSVDDFVAKALIENSASLQTLHLFGCPMVK